MKKRILSLLTVVAVAFVFSFVAADNNAYAASKAKKYYLPKEIRTYYYDDDSWGSASKIKYDKYDNVKSALFAEMIPMKYTLTYKKKGVLSKLVASDGDVLGKKYYDKKGRLKKVTVGKDTYKFKVDKNGIIKKVTLNGKKYYSVKKIKFHKNGFVSMVKYSNGNVNKYNKDGLLTVVKEKKGGKYTYKYYKKGGKVVKMVEFKNGKKTAKVTLKYGKDTTKNVWQYSCVMNYGGAFSNAYELYGMGSLAGFNSFF